MLTKIGEIKMKVFALTAICVLSIAPLCATQYVGVKLGTNDIHNTSDSAHNPKVGFKTGLKYGYALDNGIRAEVEVDFTKNDYKTTYTKTSDEQVTSKSYQSFKSWSYMANLVYDFANVQLYNLTPYAGVGVGYCESTEKNKVKFSFNSYDDKERDGVFAYQGILGFKYAMSPEYSTTFEYKYFCGQSHVKAHSFAMAVLRHF